MTTQTSIPIAIIGIGCRLPAGVTNTKKLWELLVEGRNVWSAVPMDRYNETAFYHPNPDNKGTTNHRGGHFISQDVAAFDAGFFNISPIEAQAMDPQQRLLLETTYEAFENAGIPIEKVRGSNTAVYTAIFTRDYDRNIYKDPSDIPKYHVTGSGEAIVSNRISYTFDLKGPSMTLDTGCSGGMVALHQACQSLRTGESSMALASGVNLILNPDHMFGMSNLHMLNNNGRSYPFDFRGSGYGRGEGVAAILLKRLDDALRAGDNIRAIVRNTAVNQDGKTNGITLPSQKAQQSLQRSIFERAGLDPRSVQYVEAHGTGTAAGDLAELQGIANVFCGNGRFPDSLYVGSIKSNIGHLESTSGLAGLIKTVLILENGLIPPNADFQSEKSNLKLKDWGIKVPSKLEPWPRSGVRQASVNSFGYGGTNAHVILESASTSIPAEVLWEAQNDVHQHRTKSSESHGLRSIEAPELAINESRGELGYNGGVTAITYNSFLADQIQRNAKSNGGNQPSAPEGAFVPLLFVVSAKSENSLTRILEKLRDWLLLPRHEFEHYFQDLAYNLSSRRSIMEWRYSIVARSHQELVNSLKPKRIRGAKTSSNLGVGFVFTGQGAQWFAMGRTLIFTHSQFKNSLIKSDAILRELGASWSLIDQLLLDESSSRINQSEIAQPASTALQIAIVDLLDNIGIKPQVVLGHSSGEIAAAYAAGILSQATALKVAYCRSFISSHCSQKLLSKGAMLAVGLSEEQLLPLILETQKGVVSVACVNSSSSTIVSGDEAAILGVEETLKQLGVSSRMLKVDTAYHSHHMQQVAPEYSCSLGDMDTRAMPNDIKYISSVTAAEKKSGFGPAYWVENLVSKVRFYDALHLQLANWQLMMPQSTNVLIEIGPHSVFAGPIRQTITQSFNSLKCIYLPTLVRGRDAVHSVLEMAGKMFELGYSVNLAAANSLNGAHHQFRVLHDLPTYPWDHSNTYWHESRLSQDYRLRQNPCHDLLGARILTSSSLEPNWRYMISIESLPWLAEHLVDDLVIFPGAGYICMAIEALRQLTHDGQPTSKISQFILQDVKFSKALVVPPAPLKVEIQLSLRTRRNTKTVWHDFRVSAISQDKIWYEHCSGLIKVDLASQISFLSHGDQFNLDQDIAQKMNNTITAGYSERLLSKNLYNQLRSNGNRYGPCFATVEELELGDSWAIGRVCIPDIQSTMPSNYMQPHIIHPATLDALMHAILPLYTKEYGPGSVMPVFIGGIKISQKISNTPGNKLTAATTFSPNGARSANADIDVFTVDGEKKQELVLTISQLNVRGFGTIEIDELDSTTTRNTSFQLKWGADIEYLSLKTDLSSRTMPMDEYFKHLCFKHSKMKVLQIGAEIGKTTILILRALSNSETIPIERYDFTDVSTESFIQARELLQDWVNLIHLRTLDIKTSPIERGFASHMYDLIVSTNFCYTGDYSETILTSFRKLLKPGGRLLLVAEDSSLLSNDLFNESLLRCSFNGVELSINDIHGIREKGIMVVSKAVDPGHQVPTLAVVIITTEGTKAFAYSILLALQNCGFEVSLATWSANLSKSQKIYLVVDDGQKPSLVNPSQERFKQIKTLVKEASNIFWINAHEDASATMNPEKGLVVGLARSARAENYHLKFITFDLQEVISSCLSEVLCTIKEILLTSFGNAEHINLLEETEYAYRDGQVVIPRLIPDPQITTWLTRETSKPTAVETTSYGQLSRPLKLSTPISRPMESAYFIDDESIRVPFSPLTVEIAVRMHGLNPGDFVNPTGQSESSTSLMREFAGIVSKVGPEAGTKFCEGDRVCGWSHDGAPYANFVRVDVQNISRLPESMSLEDGATVPISFMTAYHGLIELADLQKGQTILIHGAARIMGEAALTIARHIGANVLATCSTFAEEDYLVTRLGVSYTQIFSEEAPNFRERICRFTQGKGVDLVFDPDASELISESWATMASLGVYIRIGQQSKHRNVEMCMPALEKNATFVLFDLGSLISRRPHKVATLLEKVMSMFKTGAQLPDRRVTTTSIANIRDALGMIQDQKHMGRVVLEASNDTQVKVLNTRQIKSRNNQSNLDATALYVIAGGLGDLGQKLCRLMASRGAKYIVLLSRRTLHCDKKKALQDGLRFISPGLEVYSIACDISNKSMVYDTVSSFARMGLPPVKGVVQCATVLQDCILESMTSGDFQIPLQTKLYGTRHLSEAFTDLHLDFFIMLSSLSGTIGTKGQANYAAGNTFQDAFSHSQINSKTHYITLNLGMIEGTAIYENSEGRARSQNLLLQGFIPIKSKELLAFLDYAMSSQARVDQCRQAIIGIDGRSIEEAEDATPTTKTAMFVHVRSAYNNKIRSTSNTSAESRKKAIADAHSLLEVHQIITTAIVHKLSNLIALQHDKINVESPLSDFGIDSLNAIQLKSWLAREFHAAIQTSEILDESCIIALSKRVASRSTFVQEHSKHSLKQEHSNSNTKQELGAANILRKPLLNGVQHNAYEGSSIPQLPLAELQSTLDLYLTSARPFLSEDGLKHTLSIIREFREGVGIQLQKRLLHRKNDPKIDNWQYDLQVNGIYLNRRDPVYPYGIFYGSHILTANPHSQAERAAIVSIAAYKFKRRMDAGELEQDYMNEDPICMSSLQWLFNANRMPCIGRDNMYKYPGNDYLVALRRGYVFKVALSSRAKPASYNSLRASFRAILDRSEERVPAVATLTADQRDTWAKLRKMLKTVDQANDALISMIEAAAFVVCLDEGTPNSSTERCNQFLLGDPSNRWSDKSLQFVVCENGTSAHVCEHSMLDAISLKQINKFISQAILEHKAEAQLDYTVKLEASLAEKYNFTTNTVIEGHISRVQEQFKSTHAPAELSHFHFSSLGNRFFRAHKIPSKTGFQLIIQLASLIHFGRQWPSWEVLTMMLFHKGRLDWMQVVSPAMFEFCKAAMDTHTPVPEKQMLLREAAKTHTSTMTRVSRGKGFMAHLEALQEVLEDQPAPAFFQDPTWELMRVTSARKIKTDASEGLMVQEAGFLMPDPESVLVHYEVEDEGCRLYIQSTETRTGAFFEALKKAAGMVKDLLEM